VESCYEESRPKEENILPLRTKMGEINQKLSKLKGPVKQNENKLSI
jgi:hypothetical protein